MRVLHSTHRICGTVWNAITGTAIGVVATVTICSRDTPFRVGVRFDSDEAIGDNTADGHPYIENEINADANGAGVGYTGFWLDYWQNTC